MPLRLSLGVGSELTCGFGKHRTRGAGWCVSTVEINYLSEEMSCQRPTGSEDKFLVGCFCFPIRSTTQFSCTNIYEPDTVEMGTLRWRRLGSCPGTTHNLLEGMDIQNTKQHAKWEEFYKELEPSARGRLRRGWFVLPRRFWEEITGTLRSLPKY